KALIKLLQLLQPHRPYFPDQLDENSLPYIIGSKITIKQYNKFLEHQESSGYKYQRRDNGDVFIIDMGDPEHGKVVALLQCYFDVPNNTIIDPLIDVGGDDFHYSPARTGELIAADVVIYPNMNQIQQP
ncbi:6433_t:CDS:2, partial [Cetraspora pellucida]